MLRALPPEAHALYGDAMSGMVAAAARPDRPDFPPELVARAVEHALTARRPKTRYPVGRDAQIVVRLARLLPDRWLDRLFGTRRAAHAGNSASAPD